MITKFSRWYLKNRFAIVFYSALSLFPLAPLLATMNIAEEVLMALWGINQGIALFSLQRRILKFCLVPLAAVILWQLANLWLGGEAIEFVTPPVIIILAFATVIYSFLHAVNSRIVDREVIYAALNAYLFAGLCMGFTYSFVEQLVPGSFSIGGTISTSGVPLTALMYFSFVTITTTGYGDILPISDIARGLAVAEAIVGQLYLAAMLARLISVYSRPD